LARIKNGKELLKNVWAEIEVWLCEIW
jgi:hypothetical protein